MEQGRKISLTSGINFEIGGEIGKYNTLPIESLIKISEKLQELVFNIARFDINIEDTLNLNLFKLELSNFTPGSAIPTFVYTPRIQTTLTDYIKQRELVDNSLEKIFTIGQSGDYSQLLDIYHSPVVRNKMLNSVFEFRNSFGRSPVSIVEKLNGGKPQKLYEIKVFKASVKDQLLIKIEVPLGDAEIFEPVIKYQDTISPAGKKTRKTLLKYDEHGEITFKTEAIKVKNKTYILYHPLLNQVEKEEGYIIIRNNWLDLIGTGENQMEAEQNFSEEFDFLYNSLNSYGQDQLSDRLNRVKNFINMFVKQIV